MQILALSYFGVWVYSICTLIYYPIRVVIVRSGSGDIWAFFSRKRLILAAVLYFVASPFLWLVGTLGGVAGVSGGGGGDYRTADTIATVGHFVLWVLLAAALVSALLAFNHPRSSRSHT